LLGTSIASLLGVEVEYYSTALGFFERLRQVEADAERIVAHFSPISLLLSSEHYLDHLRLMLQEAFPVTTEGKDSSHPEAEIAQILDIVYERKNLFEQKRQSIVSLIGLRELERFLQTGMIGRLELDDKVRRQRIQAARNEVQHIADLMEQEPMHIKIALVEDAMPATAFQLLYRANRTMLTVSPSASVKCRPSVTGSPPSPPRRNPSGSMKIWPINSGKQRSRAKPARHNCENC
jgi:hypothetical protein